VVYPLRIDAAVGSYAKLHHPSLLRDGSLLADSVEEIRASHVLEHLPRRDSLAALAEWVRVLKPGGWLKVAVPDFDTIVATYLKWRAGELPGEAPPIEGWLMGGQVDANDFHQAGFTRQGLEEAFRELGLVDVGPWVSEVRDCASLPVSLNIQGRKPFPGEAPREKPPARAPAWVHPIPVAEPDLTFAPGAVKAVMTAPRLGFTNHAYCANRVFAPLGIGCEVSFGVFWSQGLARVLEQNLDAEILICLDYDTLFDRSDLGPRPVQAARGGPDGGGYGRRAFACGYRALRVYGREDERHSEGAEAVVPRLARANGRLGRWQDRRRHRVVAGVQRGGLQVVPDTPDSGRARASGLLLAGYGPEAQESISWRV
jgi:hypothetical protein